MCPWSYRDIVRGLVKSIEKDPQEWEQRGTFWMLFVKGAHFGIEVWGPLSVSLNTRSAGLALKVALSAREKIALWWAFRGWRSLMTDPLDNEEAMDDYLRYVDRVVEAKS